MQGTEGEGSREKRGFTSRAAPVAGNHLHGARAPSGSVRLIQCQGALEHGVTNSTPAPVSSPVYKIKCPVSSTHRARRGLSPVGTSCPPACSCKQAASVHGVPEAASEKHVPFGDGTKHLCSSAAQMFARCVILSTNKPRGKKKKSGRVLYALLGPCFKSNCHYASLISRGVLAASPNANWGYSHPERCSKSPKVSF